MPPRIVSVAALVVSPSRLDLCWFNGSISHDDRWVACPLYKNEDEANHASCMIDFTQRDITHREIVNKKCGSAYWKGRSRSLCSPTNQESNRACHCTTPNCTKQMYEDAMMGWGRTGDEENQCYSGRYNSLETPRWKLTNRKMCTRRNATMGSARSAFCVIYYEFSENVTTVEQGCTSSPEECSFNVSKYDEDGRLPCYPQDDGRTMCCCTGKDCNGYFYQDNVFEKIMEIRFNEETEYKKNMHQTKNFIPEHLHYLDLNYKFNKRIIDSVSIVVVVLSILSGLIWRALYTPIDMEKRDGTRVKSVEPTVEDVYSLYELEAEVIGPRRDRNRERLDEKERDGGAGLTANTWLGGG